MHSGELTAGSLRVGDEVSPTLPPTPHPLLLSQSPPPPPPPPPWSPCSPATLAIRQLPVRLVIPPAPTPADLPPAGTSPLSLGR